MTFPRPYKTSIFALSLGVLLIASPAYSGFQWIAPEKEEKQKPAEPVKPSPVQNVEKETLERPHNIIQTPTSPAPQTSTGAPTSIIPGAVQTQKQPQPKPKTVHMATNPAPAPEKEEKPVITTSPTPLAVQNNAAPSPAPTKKMGLKINPFPRNSDGFKPGALPPSPAPSSKTTHAKATPAKSTGSASVPPATISTPHQPSSYEVISGFGADIPLALALRQVVPPAYAYSFGDGVNPGLRVSWDGNKPWDAVMQNMLAPLKLEAHIVDKTIVIKAQKKTEPQRVSLKRQNIVDPGPGDMAKFKNSIIKAAVKTSSANQPAKTQKKVKPQKIAAYAPPPITQTKTVETIAAEPPAAPKMISMDNAKSQQWTAWRGDDLQTTLNAWSKKEGLSVQWNASREYKIRKQVSVHAPFDHAIKLLSLEGFRDSERPHIDLSGDGKTIIVSDPAA